MAPSLKVPKYGPAPEPQDLATSVVAGAGLALVNGSALVFLALFGNYLLGSTDPPPWLVPISFVVAWVANVLAAVSSARAPMWVLWVPWGLAVLLLAFGGLFV